MYRSATIAIIVACGRGLRFSKTLPKQYHKINGVPMLQKTIEAFTSHPEIDAVKVVINKHDLKLYSQLEINAEKMLPPIFGGETRQRSVQIAINDLATLNPNKVLVHDGCRPIVSRDLISDVIRHTGRYDCVVPVVKITSSLKKINEEGNGETVSQENMYYVQTPQGLKFNEVLAVYKQESLNEYNDESSLCSIHKKSVGFVDGSSKNIKITTQEDIIMAQEFDKKSSTIRVGTGFDAHRFANEESEDNFVTLGGIKINCIKKLIAHSDGDVLSHAIVDAMLGAIATGDIGQHFPPTDSKWKNADSRIFLQYADKLIKQKNGEIVNIDATIICQIPKVFPNNTIIAAEIAKTLNINKDQVSIKATTTERMGFTGRKEGIAVHAIVAIRIWE